MTTVIKNVFSQDEILTLHRLLSSYAGEGNKIENTGRYIISTTMFEMFPGMKDIITKIETYASNTINKKMKMFISAFHLYKMSYGIPSLKPHIDEAAGEVVFDYQLDSSLSWPIKVNKKIYELNNNDALIFAGETVAHGRTQQVFNGNDYVLMFIVNLISDEHWANFHEQNPKDIELIKKEIFDIREDKENW